MNPDPQWIVCHICTLQRDVVHREDLGSGQVMDEVSHNMTYMFLSLLPLLLLIVMILIIAFSGAGRKTQQSTPEWRRSSSSKSTTAFRLKFSQTYRPADARVTAARLDTRATDITSGNGRHPPESVIGKKKSTDDCATTKEKFSSLRLPTRWKYSLTLPRLIYCCGFTRPRGWRGRSSRNWIGLLATIQSRAPCATFPPNKRWGHFKHWSTAAATTKCCPDTEWHLRGWQRSAANVGFQAIMLVGSSTGWTMIRWAHCAST